MGTNPVLINSPVLFFDDYCLLCNRLVRLLINIDKQHLLRFSGLSGNLASACEISAEYLKPVTIVLLVENKKYFRSDAILLIAAMLGYPYKLFSFLRILPSGIRNFIYDYVAVHRSKWFGRAKCCYLPTDKNKYLFLN